MVCAIFKKAYWNGGRIVTSNWTPPRQWKEKGWSVCLVCSRVIQHFCSLTIAPVFDTVLLNYVFYVLHLKQFGGWIFSWLNTDFSQHWSLLEHKAQDCWLYFWVTALQQCPMCFMEMLKCPGICWQMSSGQFTPGQKVPRQGDVLKCTQDVFWLYVRQIFHLWTAQWFLFNLFKHTSLFVIRNQNDLLQAVFKVELGTHSTKYGDPE